TQALHGGRRAARLVPIAASSSSSPPVSSTLSPMPPTIHGPFSCRHRHRPLEAAPGLCRPPGGDPRTTAPAEVVTNRRRVSKHGDAPTIRVHSPQSPGHRVVPCVLLGFVTTASLPSSPTVVAQVAAKSGAAPDRPRTSLPPVAAGGPRPGCHASGRTATVLARVFPRPKRRP